MTYRGQVKNGVVVFEGSAPEEGTEVRIAPVKKARRPRRGSAEAILSSGAHWHGDAGEMERLLAELKEMKWAEVRAQQAKEE